LGTIQAENVIDSASIMKNDVPAYFEWELISMLSL
jgi:hypothetical protein